MELMSGGGNPAPAPTSYRHLLGVSSTDTDSFIVAIDKVTLAQSAASAGSDQQGSRWGCLAIFGTFEKGTGHVGLFACWAWPDLRQCALSVGPEVGTEQPADQPPGCMFVVSLTQSWGVA